MDYAPFPIKPGPCLLMVRIAPVDGTGTDCGRGGTTMKPVS